MIKYSKFTDNIGSGNFNVAFSQNTDKFQKSGGGWVGGGGTHTHKHTAQHALAPMPKCDFNKVAKQFYWNHTLAWVLSRKFAAYFQNTFS